jgi:hypothetical protein
MMQQLYTTIHYVVSHFLFILNMKCSAMKVFHFSNFIDTVILNETNQ